jgi:hypothetical protein
LFLSVLSVVIAFVAYQTHLQQQQSSSSSSDSWTASPFFPVIIIGGGFALGALIGKWWKQRHDKKCKPWTHKIFLDPGNSCLNTSSISISAKPVLDPKEFQKFPLVEKKKISPNTAM